MNNFFQAVKLTDDVYWVGAIDWNIRDFHGYTTPRGSTYNAYLIMADKVTLIDTVKAPFKDEMLSRISSVCDPGKIDYIVSNHAEMDHSGCLPEVIAAVDPERVFASAVGANVLREHFAFDREIIGLKDGEELSLGNRSLSFMETRMLHWPDSMFTYLKEEQLLFSQDAFGMHLATQERFDDEVAAAILEYEAATYFANILLPYAALATKLIDRLQRVGIRPKIVAPDHGPIWRSSVDRIVSLYGRWAEQKPRLKAVVAYGTMWHSTEAMARAIGEGLSAGGIQVKVMDTGVHHRSAVVYELLEAGALVVGSSTLNNNLLPHVADCLTYLKGLKPKNLVGAAFGSYGWSGESVGQIEETLRDMKVELVGEQVKAKHVPTVEIIARCRRLGETMAAEVKKRAV
ncbi:MAG: FprA family A-type flavoprotein [Smithellaceae bacterium]|nr:FprA family A-type flavoprotein [Smithellaceae bacterium]